MNAVLAIALIVGSGLMAGVFFAFSTFVMKALAQLPAAQGVAAMQRINVVVLNPMFLGCFMGTAVLGLLAIGLAVFDWRGVASAWMVAAGLLYVLGCFGVTMAFNVPRNEGLARLDADAPEATGYWPRYVREWTFWNHVRTVAPTLAVVCAALSLRV